MKCPYKGNRIENTISKYIYDENQVLDKNAIVTYINETFGECDGNDCAAFKNGVCQYVLVEKRG